MNTVTIENLSSSKSVLTQHSINKNEYFLNYGAQKKNFDSNVTLKIRSQELLKVFQATPSCGGCTKVFVRVLDNNTRELDIYYNSELLGRINKSITVKINSENYKILLQGVISKP